MAIIYTYPTATPKASDKLIGTVTEDVNAVNVVKGNPTRSFTLSAVQSLFNQDVVNVVVPVTATLLKTLTSSNKLTLLAAPGAGKALYIENIIMFVDAGTTPFTFTSDIDLAFASGGQSFEAIPLAQVNSTDDILYRTGNSQTKFLLAQNEPLELTTVQVAKTTAGNGIVYFNLTYKTVNTTASMV